MQPVTNSFYSTISLPQRSSYTANTQAFQARTAPTAAVTETPEPLAIFPSVGKAVGLVSAGFLTALSGHWLLSSSGKPFKSVLPAMPGVASAQREHQVYLSLNDNATSLMGMAFYNPALRGTLVAYVGASVLGYLATSVLQGTQEAWVRQRETDIRAQLVERLHQVFRTSIQKKQQADASLKDGAKANIRALLVKHHITNPDAFLVDWAQPESEAARQRIGFEPTHRTVTTAFDSGSRRFSRGFAFQGLSNPDPQGFSQNLGFNADEQQLAWAIQGGLFTAGLALGGIVCGVRQWFNKRLRSAAAIVQSQKPLSKRLKNTAPVQHKVIETINAMNLEALFLMKDKRMLGLFLVLGAVGQIGKLVLDGLRNIEVTRVNAITEYRYQAENWLRRDPGFHQIAEEEALRHELALLEKDLPLLRQAPSGVLQQRIQTLLTNIGRNSAPKYFLMTPPVNLVDARS
ncbi:MAG: hypothetical protein K2X01_06585 [Cyanobacteria bacterium]|nr:hypothetical protein [Cyanobacteriota bacterium]